MLNGMEFQTVGAAYLKALRPTLVHIINRIALASTYKFTVSQRSETDVIHADLECRSLLRMHVTWFDTV